MSKRYDARARSRWAAEGHAQEKIGRLERSGVDEEDRQDMAKRLAEQRVQQRAATSKDQISAITDQLKKAQEHAAAEDRQLQREARWKPCTGRPRECGCSVEENDEDVQSSSRRLVESVQKDPASAG